MNAPAPDPLLLLSTDDLDPRERFDYWREMVFCYFDAVPDAPDAVQRFESHVVSLISERGEINSYRSSDVTGQRTRRQYQRDGGDEVALIYVLKGKAVYQPENGVPTEAAAGKFFCYDSARPARVQWSAGEQLHFSLPRAAVMEAIGGDVPEPDVLARSLNESRLAPYLLSQIRRLTREAPQLSPFERATMLDGTLELAKAVLRGSLHPARAFADGETALYYSACTHIDAHLGKPDLSAAEIAAALGCSRAHLYRVFARHGTTVAARLRESRLRQARRLLEGAPQLSIELIAWRCGYADSSSFGKAFKRRFGASPYDWRARLQALALDPK